MRGYGQIPALYFMKPLSSSFHTLQTVLNCKFDCLIIACLKMQIWNIKISAPISTIKSVFSNEIQCSTNLSLLNIPSLSN